MSVPLVSIVAIVTALVAWSAAAESAEPGWPKSLVIATASPGGTYDVYGAGLAKLLSKVLGVPVSTRETEGPIENIELIAAGKVQIGFVTIGAALQAWTGTGDWTQGKQYRSIRALFPMYDTSFQFVVLKESGIRSFADLAGKRAGVGPQTGTGGTYVPRILSALAIDAAVAYDTYEELAAQLVQRKIDMLAAVAGTPSPVVADLETREQIRFVPLSKDQILTLRLAIPELATVAVPPGTYPSLTNGYQTVGFYNFAIADSALPDDLTYRIVDAVFANHQAMVKVHPAAAATVPANLVQNPFLPYHDGASRYYTSLFAAGVPHTE